MKKSIIVLLMLIVAVSLFVGCKNEPEAKTYKVGDTGPAGGIIFYVNPNAKEDGWTYLEAAKSDFKTEIQWAPDTEAVVDIETKTGIGEGKENTKKINDLENAEQYSAAYSFYETDVYENGFRDWFLPSKEELVLLLKNTELADSITIDQFYWSSSETYDYESGAVTNETYAVKKESNGLFSGPQKRDKLYSVRLIRMF